MLVSFLDIWAGLSGLLSVLTSISVAYALGLSRIGLKNGSYSFNSLLVGLGLGIYFQASIEFYFIVFIASILTLLLTIALEGVIGKYYLPYLSVPFLFGIWIMTLATRDLSALGISERGIYVANELYSLGGKNLIDIYQWWDNVQMNSIVKTYLLSLGAIFFQYNVLSGIIILIGLLIYSRIAFGLSVLGFYTAVLFYQFTGAEVTTISYSYIGFNYILTAIAIGGFFIISSPSSYLWAVLLLPIVSIVTIGLHKVFFSLQLPLYSLPFNIVVLMFLYMLKFRTIKSKYLIDSFVQMNVPEKNLYYFRNSIERFGSSYHYPVSLPFWGDWKVSQGHNGEYTHIGEWQHAWDFIIVDIDGKQFKDAGDYPTDYFCFGKPITAAVDGVVSEVIDGIEDNIIGEVNTRQNWGNTIVIKHTDYLYTKVSHLKNNSIKVKKGENVTKGQVIAASGNSGRSPYPHLHFQVQATPFIGSRTIDYPICYYISTENDSNYSFKFYDKPLKDEIVSNIVLNPLLKKAFHFIPGQRLVFDVEGSVDGMNIENGKYEWEVKTDQYNVSYIHCKRTDSYAYFYNDDTMHYFKDYLGSKKSFLYLFFQALFKVQMGYYQDIKLNDKLPIHLTFRKHILFFQDFIAPFYMFLKSKYSLNYISSNDEFAPSQIKIEAKTENFVFNKKIREKNFNITVNRNGIEKIIVKSKKKTLTAVVNNYKL